MKTYEGMFLLDAGQANFDEAVAPIRTVMERNSAEIIVMKKWDERRLAYEIRGRRRGLYALTYFKAEPEAIGAIERDVQLSEDLLRVLILSADHVSAEAMNAPVPSEVEHTRGEDEGEGGEGRPRRSRDEGEAKPVAKEQPAEAKKEPAAEAPKEQPAAEATEENAAEDKQAD